MSDRAQELLAALVGFPTVAGTPNRELIDWAAERLVAVGADVEISPAHRADGFNLHAVLGPAEAPGLVLSAHTDVVAVEGQAWTADPFALRRAGGRLYGRGTADMKGFIAAVLAALEEHDPHGRGRPVHVVLSCDEELGCQGIQPLLPRLRTAVAPGSLTIVGEPTRLRVVERHKGKLALRVDVRGVAGHSAHPAQGVNAVEHAARLIVALGELAGTLAAETPQAGFAVGHTTLSTGPIRGGTSLNIIPDHCTFELEARLVPGVDREALYERVAQIAERVGASMRSEDPAAGLQLTRIIDYPALAGGGEPAALGEVAACAGDELAGSGRPGGAADYGTEAGFLYEALGGTVVVCGPGDMAQAHRPDEYLEVEQLERAEAFLARLLDAA